LVWLSVYFFFFSSRRRHTRFSRDWSSDVCSSDLWRWDNNGNRAKAEDNSAAMVAATPATIDIDYILAERSREYFGEGYRWYDLRSEERRVGKECRTRWSRDH